MEAVLEVKVLIFPNKLPTKEFAVVPSKWLGGNLGLSSLGDKTLLDVML